MFPECSLNVKRSLAAGEGGRTKLIFEIPSRGLIGYDSQFATTTSGSGIMTRSFLRYIYATSAL
jgi:GTP-binding protein